MLAISTGPANTWAREAPADATDAARFEASFHAGQAKYDAGDFLAAARIWREAAGALPRTAEHRANDEAIHEYLADAYDNALQVAEDPAVLREALTVLDEYAAQFAAAFPGEALSPRVAAARDNFRERLQALEAAAKPPPPPPASPVTEPPSPPPERAVRASRPWRPLAIGSGVAFAGGAAMLGVFIASYVRLERQEDAFEMSRCNVDTLVGACADYYRDGKSANASAVAGTILAPVLVGAGIGMLVVALKRKRAAERLAFRPLLGRGMAGLSWQTRF